MNACDSGDRVRSLYAAYYVCFGLSLSVHAALASVAMSLCSREERPPPKPLVWVVTELAAAAAEPAPAAAHEDVPPERQPPPRRSTPKRQAVRRAPERPRPALDQADAHQTPAEPATQAAEAARAAPDLTDAVPTPAQGTSSSTEPHATSPSSQFPTVIRQVKPAYPTTARRDRIAGVVRIEVRLDVHGRVVEPLRVVKSIPELDAAALAAVRQWLFTPARDEHGVAVPAIVQIPLRFELR